VTHDSLDVLIQRHFWAELNELMHFADVRIDPLIALFQRHDIFGVYRFPIEPQPTIKKFISSPF
jgi:hypothetical protein